jgi:hypothetical protein
VNPDVQRRMHADTVAIRGYSTAALDLSADLQAAAAALSRDLAPAVTGAFGPVGARFAQALAEAAASLTRGVTNVGDHLAAHGTTSGVAAGAFDDVESRTQARIVRI